MNRIEQDLRSRGEQKVLSALMRDAGAIRHLRDLTPAHFSHDIHGVIFACIKQLIAGEYAVNASAIYVAMLTRNRAFAWSLPYLLAVQSIPALPSHAGYYACVMFDQDRPL